MPQFVSVLIEEGFSILIIIASGSLIAYISKKRGHDGPEAWDIGTLLGYVLILILTGIIYELGGCMVK